MWKAFETHACNNPSHRQTMKTCIHRAKGEEREDEQRERGEKDKNCDKIHCSNTRGDEKKKTIVNI